LIGSSNTEIRLYFYSFIDIMPTTKGSINFTDDSRFVATFTIDDIKYVYSGQISPNQGSLHVAKATLTYGDTGDLSGTHPFVGRVGISDATFCHLQHHEWAQSNWSSCRWQKG
jgi:hypothetical protein